MFQTKVKIPGVSIFSEYICPKKSKVVRGLMSSMADYPIFTLVCLFLFFYGYLKFCGQNNILRMDITVFTIMKKCHANLTL